MRKSSSLIGNKWRKACRKTCHQLITDCSWFMPLLIIIIKKPYKQCQSIAHPYVRQKRERHREINAKMAVNIDNKINEWRFVTSAEEHQREVHPHRLSYHDKLTRIWLFVLLPGQLLLSLFLFNSLKVNSSLMFYLVLFTRKFLFHCSIHLIYPVWIHIRPQNPDKMSLIYFKYKRRN